MKELKCPYCTYKFSPKKGGTPKTCPYCDKKVDFEVTFDSKKIVKKIEE
ncbi:MAG: hypothetical protein HYS32_04460 [Candidatus Woesearchaeota archaeon]|nr:MAG: hypothetical protein HYS32_04460 [Candidatus Woesearchaeota archaeon]